MLGEFALGFNFSMQYDFCPLFFFFFCSLAYESNKTASGRDNRLKQVANTSSRKRAPHGRKSLFSSLVGLGPWSVIVSNGKRLVRPEVLSPVAAAVVVGVSL